MIPALFLHLLALTHPSHAHMSIWTPAMLAFDGPKNCGNYCESFPVNPLGPNLPTGDEWWFRGPDYTGAAQTPDPSNAEVLPAGGKITLQITCHKAAIVNDSLISGCALAIADKEEFSDVGWDDLVVFSVQPECVKKKVPKNMPSCSGSVCICAWFWLANTGTGNFYMTGFFCRVTGSNDRYEIASPSDPVDCKDDSSNAWNEPHNVVSPGNDNRPGYHSAWSFTQNGAQDDIFVARASSRAHPQRTSGVAQWVQILAFVFLASIWSFPDLQELFE
ncbi:hypothetical protein MNV49_006239 [Pseudohyphozyma bogoriensis]|nr:hypothetical protein MNV49_006239 [Pseudohyphozyma bogoriensis]